MKTYKILTFALAVVGLTACSDSFLDKLPDERVEINTEQKITQLLTTAYPTSNYSWLCELSSDNLIDNNTPHIPSNPNAEQTMAHYNLSSYARWDDEAYRFEPAKSATFSESDSPGSIWGSFYGSISAANHVLEAIDNIEKENNGALSARLKAARAEALLIRAYDHYILVNIFSQAYKDADKSKNDIGIPYVTKTETQTTVNYPRIPVSEVYELIEKDIEDAFNEEKAGVTDIYFAHPKWRFNTRAAHAFAARFYLTYHKWEKVIEHADAVLGNDPDQINNMLLNYADFQDCATMSDYGKVWQDPEKNNNLMLFATYSVLGRRALGYRYSQASQAVRDIFFHRSDMWNRWTVNPTALVSGMIFAYSTDYGYISCKISEEFQYTDKLAGIGYAHIIQRGFTSAVLLLERAEAKVMLRDFDGALNDLVAYSKNSQTFGEEDQKRYAANNGMKPLDQNILDNWYTNVKSPNCFADWEFANDFSSDYNITDDMVEYMNCINDFRRFETAFEGLRFFDLKRWGIEYSHTIGLEGEVVTLSPNDARRAVEVPWEVLASGLESSRTEPATVVASIPPLKMASANEFLIK